jgi:hypothetical protein
LGAYGEKRRRSFLKKRTKKLLLRDAKVVARPLAKNEQSFFASFCSKKEVLSFLLLFKIIFLCGLGVTFAARLWGARRVT